jgi:hypothetical protein
MNKIIWVCLLMTFFASPVFAQNKPSNSTVTQGKKFKPPVLKTLLLNFTDSVVVSVTEAQQALGGKLTVMDAAKKTYTLTYYQVLYERRVMTEDEETGKLTPTRTLVSDHFKTTPLPQTWVSQISSQLKPGEMIYFFDIIVKDAQGRVMYAPDLKLILR